MDARATSSCVTSREMNPGTVVPASFLFPHLTLSSFLFCPALVLFLKRTAVPYLSVCEHRKPAHTHAYWSFFLSFALHCIAPSSFVAHHYQRAHTPHTKKGLRRNKTRLSRRVQDSFPVRVTNYANTHTHRHTQRRFRQPSQVSWRVLAPIQPYPNPHSLDAVCCVCCYVTPCGGTVVLPSPPSPPTHTHTQLSAAVSVIPNITFSFAGNEITMASTQHPVCNMCARPADEKSRYFASVRFRLDLLTTQLRSVQTSTSRHVTCARRTCM